MEYDGLLILAIAWIIIYLLLRFAFRIDFPGVKLYPLGFVIKSERSVRILEEIASAAPSAIKVASDLGIALGLGMMAFAIYVLGRNLGTYLLAPAQVGPQNIVIPLVIGVTIRLEHLPYMLIALGIVLLTHEGMHGVIARLEGVRLRSTGLFLFYLFPGGFVEPDEEEFRRAPSRTRARIAAGGSFANLAVGVAVILLMMAAFSPAESGVVVLETGGNSTGIQVNDVIYSINGVPVNRMTLLENISASSRLTIETSRGAVTHLLESPIDKPMAWVLWDLGVRRLDYYFPTRMPLWSPQAEYALYKMLWWTQLMAVNVAIFNMMPIAFLDGSLLANALLESRIRSEKVLKAVNHALTGLSIALITLNIAFTFKTFGFLRI